MGRRDKEGVRWGRKEEELGGGGGGRKSGENERKY